MLWDQIEFEEDIGSLIAKPNPDFDVILTNAGLIPAMRSNDQNLINFFTKQENFDKLLEIIYTRENKIAKIVVEITLLQKSPILKKLFSSQELVESLVKHIEQKDYLRIGYISRLIIKGVTTQTEQVAPYFNNSTVILPVLLQNIDTPSICDVVDEYVNVLKTEDQWVLFTFIHFLHPAGKHATLPSTWTGHKKEINTTLKALAKYAFNEQHFKSFIVLLTKHIGKCKNDEVKSSLSKDLTAIFSNTKNNENLQHLFELAQVLPTNPNVIELAVKLVQTKLPYQAANISALDLLSMKPDENLAPSIKVIIERFVNDESNTFHHQSFVKFVEASVKNDKLRAQLISILPPIILKKASSANWRQNVTCVCFYLELATILDQFIQNNQEWANFKNTEMKKWSTKDSFQEDDKQDKPSKPQTSQTTATQSKTPESTFGDFPSFDTSNEKPEEKIEFPSFDSAPSDNTGNGFPAFPETPQESSDITFPTFSENNDNAFPSFPEATNNPSEKVEFPSFEDTPEDNEDIKFPSFEEPPKKSQKKEEIAFPTFDEPTIKSNKEDVTFPSFDDAPSAAPKEEEVSFPSFGDVPSDDNKEEIAFPAFEEAKDKNEDDVSFPAFEEEAPPPTPKPIIPIIAPKPTISTENIDVSIEHFMELLNNPCWEYNGPSPAELFGQKDQFSSPEEAFTFLINQS